MSALDTPLALFTIDLMLLVAVAAFSVPTIAMVPNTLPAAPVPEYAVVSVIVCVGLFALFTATFPATCNRFVPSSVVVPSTMLPVPTKYWKFALLPATPAPVP